MNRYMTGRYVAVDWAEAIRLAQLDGTAVGDIRCQQDIELLHRTDWWAWWSDERLTTAIGLPESLRPAQLSADAAVLFFDVWMSGLTAPECGWAVLARVKQIVDSERVAQPSTFQESANSIWEKLTVLLTDERQCALYRCWYQDEVGYQCDLMNDFSD